MNLHRLGGVGAVWLAGCTAAFAHPVPFTYVDLRPQPGFVEVVLVAHVFDVAHDLNVQPPEKLLEGPTLESQAEAIKALVRGRLELIADGSPVTVADWSAPEPLPDRQSLRLRARYELAAQPGRLDVRTLMFPYDPEHKTFLNVYDEGAVAAQAILDRNRTRFEYFANTRRGKRALLARFVPAGVRNMVGSPDHLLFLVALLFLGGSIRQLMLVLCAFTIAHSITLVLAALRMVIPPANAVDPAIALSVMYVGADNLLVRAGGRDTRVWVAAAFGLIHGFGFASALRETDLPTWSAGWTVFGFNLGVEIGQVLVVVVAASLFAWIRGRSERAGKRLVLVGSIIAMMAGAFWFVQRVFFSGGTA